jgi:hypothetical protein
MTDEDREEALGAMAAMQSLYQTRILEIQVENARRMNKVVKLGWALCCTAASGTFMFGYLLGDADVKWPAAAIFVALGAAGILFDTQARRYD